MEENVPAAADGSHALREPKASPLQLPPELIAALAVLDSRPTAFDCHEVDREIGRAVPDRQAIAPELRRGAWAEKIAFAFSTHRVAGGGPWGTYFQPAMSATKSDGTSYYSPDLGEVDADVLAHWAARAKTAKHPGLVARYADLVWDVSQVVTKSKRGRDAIEYARLAIDGYIAASRIDSGDGWGETRANLGRALRLAMSVNDSARTAEAVNAHIEYVDRTADNDLVDTYCYLFDDLLPAEKGPQLEPEHERAIVGLFESKLAMMSTPGGSWDVDPHSSQRIGMRLAAYYQRKNLAAERTRVIRLVAEAFERRAKLGDALVGLMFLEEARDHFGLAGLGSEAERVQLEAQKLGPQAQQRLARTRVSHEIPTEDVERFLDAIVEGGAQVGLVRLVRHFLPDQGEIARNAEDVAKNYPLYEMFAARPVMLDHGHIEADVGDSTGDPDGLMVHRTAQALQFQVPWISWILERLVRDGLTPDQAITFVEKCPLFSADRSELVRRGIGAHFIGDYTQAIHVLIPQIEHAVVSMSPLGGKPSNKPHRTGRGVMQFKNLNDLLVKGAWPIPGEGGENLRMYLLSALAHPKGLNIRNDVCHGLWPADRFTRMVSERVLHVLLTVSLLRAEEKADSGEDASQGGAEVDAGGAGPSS